MTCDLLPLLFVVVVVVVLSMQGAGMSECLAVNVYGGGQIRVAKVTPSPGEEGRQPGAPPP